MGLLSLISARKGSASPRPIYAIRRVVELELHPVERSNHCGRRDHVDKLGYTVECLVEGRSLDENGFLIDNMEFQRVAQGCAPDGELRDSCEGLAAKIAAGIRSVRPSLTKGEVSVTPADLRACVTCRL